MKLRFRTVQAFCKFKLNLKMRLLQLPDVRQCFITIMKCCFKEKTKKKERKRKKYIRKEFEKMLNAKNHVNLKNFPKDFASFFSQYCLWLCRQQNAFTKEKRKGKNNKQQLFHKDKRKLKNPTDIRKSLDTPAQAHAQHPFWNTGSSKQFTNKISFFEFFELLLWHWWASFLYIRTINANCYSQLRFLLSWSWSWYAKYEVHLDVFWQQTLFPLSNTEDETK